MARKRLTQRTVDALKPRSTRYNVQEDGLIVEVNPTGKIVYFGAYRQHGERHKPKLGEHPKITLGEARTLLLNIQHDIQVKDVKVKQTDLTLMQFIEGDFRDWCLANRKQGQETLDRLTHQLKDHRLGRTKLRDVTPQNIEAWKAQQIKQYESSTVVRNMGDLSRVFQLAIEWELLRRSPMTKVKRPKVDRAKEKLYLSEAEIKRLDSALAEWDFKSHFGTPTEQQYHQAYLPIIVRLAINTGMRRGEIMQLQWKDIDPHENTITVRGATAKSGSTRVLPVNTKLTEALKQWATVSFSDDEEPDPEARVFPVSHFRKSWEKLRKNAQLDHIVFHTLRHHFASTLVLRGTSLSVVRDLMGHTDIATTQLYLSVRQEDRFEAVELL